MGWKTPPILQGQTVQYKPAWQYRAVVWWKGRRKVDMRLRQEKVTVSRRKAMLWTF